MRRSSPTKIDRRRLRDGEVVMNQSSNIENMSYDDLLDLRSTLFDGIAAMQSLDDMGPDLNKQAWNDMLTLQKRLASVEKKLKELDK